MSVKENKNKKYDLVAPEGGWGYMICLAYILNMITISSFVNCFGMTFKELFIELKMDSTSITLFNGINSFTIATSGFLASPLLKYTSIRQLGLVGAFILNVGVFGTVFVKSKFQFFFCQAFLQSLGHGIIYNLSCTMLNNYFVKRRILAVSFTQTVVATTAFLTPLFVKWTTEMYGSRGTFLLISGVSMHSIFAMAVMQPVAWHMKRVEVPEDKENETKLLLVKDKKYVTNKEDLTASIKSYRKSENVAKGTGDNTYTVEENAKEHGNRLKRFVHHVFDVSLFRTYLLSNACIGAALIMFTEMTFTLMVPQALYSMGWNENQVAWAVSLNALGDLVTRTLLICMSSMLAKLGSHEVYVVGLAIAFGSRIGMLWSDNRTAMATFMTIMGISRSSIMVLTNVVIADAVHQDQFSGAVGLLLLTFGVFNLTVGPVIGAVRDLTDSYTTAFYILTSFYAIVLIFWSIELLYKKTKHKRQPKTDISSKP